MSAAQIQDEEPARSLSIDSDVVCRFQASPYLRDCPRFTHFRVAFRANLTARLSLLLSWDPWQVPKPTWTDTYDVLGLSLPPRKTWFDHYALRFRLAEDWELSVEDWTSATLLPDSSGLSFAHALQDSGWKQTALRLSLIKPEWTHTSLSFIAGFGEGERLKEEDHKPYLGFVGRSEIIPSLEWQAAWSIDTDSVERDRFFWLNDAERPLIGQGFRTERQALSFILNGQNPKARGLRISLGLQRNFVRGPQNVIRHRAVSPLEGPFDPTEILAESWGQRSEIERATLALSASYLILAEYVLAFHRQDLQISLGPNATVRSCNSLAPDGSCLDTAVDRHHIRVRESTWGLGRMNEKGWSLFLESLTISYDNLYELYHFAPAQDQRQRTLSFAQLRLSLGW